ncbi:hypothetical protein H4219_000198 [Mycoemilia scoparia]|uniref:Uncharacterized protein n=1 Tax=Mycoemilia scoparia TaxID=417184 RepID=A0A9W8A6X9_9FUNG|nr:hypothetical protein H4219_000198 [Mycoemilia scoparia]
MASSTLAFQPPHSLPTPASTHNSTDNAGGDAAAAAAIEAFEIRLASHTEDQPTLSPNSDLLGAVVVQTNGLCTASKVALSFIGREIVGNHDVGNISDKLKGMKGTRALKKVYFEEEIELWKAKENETKEDEIVDEQQKPEFPKDGEQEAFNTKVDVDGDKPENQDKPKDEDSKEDNINDETDQSAEKRKHSIDAVAENNNDEQATDADKAEYKAEEQIVEEKSAPAAEDPSASRESLESNYSNLAQGTNIFHFATRIPAINYPTRMISLCDSSHQDFRIEYLLEANLIDREGNIIMSCSKECSFQPSVQASKFYKTPYSTTHIISDDDDKPCVVIKASFPQREYISGDKINAELFLESMRQSRQITRVESQLRLRIDCRLQRTSSGDSALGSAVNGGKGSASAPARSSAYNDNPDVLWTRTIDLEEPRELELRPGNDTKLTARPKSHIAGAMSFRNLGHKRSLFSIRNGHRSCRAVIQADLPKAIAAIPSFFLGFTYEIFVIVHLGGLQSSTRVTRHIPIVVATDADTGRDPSIRSGLSYSTVGNERESLITSIASGNRPHSIVENQAGVSGSKSTANASALVLEQVSTSFSNMYPSAVEMMRCKSLDETMKPVLFSSDDPSAFLCHPRLSAILVNQGGGGGNTGSNRQSLISTSNYNNNNSRSSANVSSFIKDQERNSVDFKPLEIPTLPSIRQSEDSVSPVKESFETARSNDENDTKLSGATLKYISAVLAKGRISTLGSRDRVRPSDKVKSAELETVPEADEQQATGSDIAYLSDSETHLLASELPVTSFISDDVPLNSRKSSEYNKENNSRGANIDVVLKNISEKVQMTPKSAARTPKTKKSLSELRPYNPLEDKSIEVKFGFDSDEFNDIFSDSKFFKGFEGKSEDENQDTDSKALSPIPSEDGEEKISETPKAITVKASISSAESPSLENLKPGESNGSKERGRPAMKKAPDSNETMVKRATETETGKDASGASNVGDNQSTNSIDAISFSTNDELEDKLKLDTKWTTDLQSSSSVGNNALTWPSSSRSTPISTAAVSLAKINPSASLVPALKASRSTAVATAVAVATATAKSSPETPASKLQEAGSRTSLSLRSIRLSEIRRRLSRWVVRK